jgi:guanine deaminase
MGLFIRGGKVFNSQLNHLQEADILIDGDCIAAVGRNLDAPTDVRELDASKYIILPGLINAHTHSHNNFTKGSGDNWTLEDQLNHGAALNANRTPDDVYVCTAIGAIEMLKTGCTAAFDLFMGTPAPTDDTVEAVVRAYKDVGLRAVIAPSVADVVFYRVIPKLIDFLPPDLRKTVESMRPVPTESLLKLTENAIRRWHKSESGRIRIAVSPTTPGQNTDEFLRGCSLLSRKYGVGIHTHLAETKVQAIYGLQRWGKSLVAHLADIGLLSPDFVGAHAVWLTEEDIKMLADAGASVAHNPAANLKLGSGIAPIREMLEHNLNVGLGTDGSLSSDNQNMFEAMRFGATIAKVRFPYQQNRWVSSRDAWKMATLGSAYVLGMADGLGAVAPGRKADLVLLRSDSINLRPMNDAINALVYAESGDDVDTVLVNGKVVLEHGRVLTVGEESLRVAAQEAVDRLRAKNADAWVWAEQLMPYIQSACQETIKTPHPINRYATSILTGEQR